MIKISKEWKHITFIVILSCIFFWKILLNPNKIIYTEYVSDVISQFSPYKNFISNSWKIYRELPLWNPYTFIGSPFVGNPLSSMFYPTNVFHLVFESDSVFGYLFLLDFIIAGTGTYIFCRYIGLKKWGSLISSIIFIFSGIAISRIYAGHLPNFDAISLMPLSFLLLDIALKKNKVFYGAIAGVPIGLQFLAGHLQFSLYSTLGLGIYFLLRTFFTFLKNKSFRNLAKYLLIFLTALTVGALLSMIQTLPSLEFSKYSTRYGGVSYKFATSYSFPPEHLITFFAPEIFGTPLDNSYWGGRNFWELCVYTGIFPIILVITSLITDLDEKRILFLSIAVFTILFALGSNTSIFFIFYNYVPPFNYFRMPSTILFVSVFALSILAGFGAQSIVGKMNETNKEKLFYLVKFFVIIALISICGVNLLLIKKQTFTQLANDMLDKKYEYFEREEHKLRYDIDFYRSKIPLAYSHIVESILQFAILTLLSCSLLILKLKDKLATTHFKVIVLVFILSDLWFFGVKYINVESVSDVFHERINLDMTKGNLSEFRILDTTGSLQQFISMRNGLEIVDGYDPIQLKHYREFMDYFFGSDTDWERMPYISVNVSRLDGNSEILGLINVKYIITDETLADKSYELIHTETTNVYDMYTKTDETKTIYIYENKNFLSRSFFVPRAILVKHDEILATLNSEAFNPGTEVIVDSKYSDILKEAYSDIEYKEASIIEYTPNKVVIGIKTEEPGFLVFSDSWYPGWEAYDNGEKKEILEANYFLRAVQLEPDDHTITFVYKPKSFKIGATITTTTFIILLVIILYERFYDPNDSGNNKKVRTGEKAKICIATSAGGHLTEIKLLERFYKKRNRFFITFKRNNSLDLAKKEKVYFVKDPGRNPLSLLINILQTFRIMLKEKPDFVISNGAGVAIPACYITKLMGKKVIFIESFCRMEPSLSGQVAYPVSDLFLVQYPNLIKEYKKAVYVGGLI